MTIPRSRSLEAVRAVLEQAVRSGDLSRSDAEWSISRLNEGARGPAPRLDGSNRRDEVIGAAISIFRRDGFHRSKLDDVATELGLTKATVYHYFASKNELLGAICERAMTQGEEAVERGIAAAERPADQLRQLFEEYALALIGQAALTVLIRNFDDLQPEAQRRLGQRRRRLERRVSDIVEAGVAAGELRADDADIATLTAFGAINWLYVWYSPTGPMSAEQICAALANQVMHGLIAC